MKTPNDIDPASPPSPPAKNSRANIPDNLVPIRWDDATIAAELVNIPEPCRETYARLKRLVRDEWSRDPGQFSQHAAALGVNVARKTWNQILRGHAWVDIHGAARRLITIPEFLAAAQTILADAAQSDLRGQRPFIWTQTAEDIRDYLFERNALEKSNRWGLIIGETGAGKSATFRQLKRDHPGKVFWFETPENASRREIIYCMGAAYGFSPKTASAHLKDNLFRAVKRDHLWIFDNAQRLFVADDHEFFAIDFLIRLQEHTRCSPILSLTPYDESRLRQKAIGGFWEQIIGRSGGERSWLRLPDYPSQADCLQHARAYGLADADEHAAEIAALARHPGRIRILFEVLQQAVALADAESRALTIDDIRAFAPKPRANDRRAR